MTTTSTSTTQSLEARLAALEEEVAVLRDRLEEMETVEAVREGMAEIDRGEGVPAIEALQALAKKHGIVSN